MSVFRSLFVVCVLASWVSAAKCAAIPGCEPKNNCLRYTLTFADLLHSSFSEVGGAADCLSDAVPNADGADFVATVKAVLSNVTSLPVSSINVTLRGGASTVPLQDNRECDLKKGKRECVSTVARVTLQLESNGTVTIQFMAALLKVYASSIVFPGYNVKQRTVGWPILIPSDIRGDKRTTPNKWGAVLAAGSVFIMILFMAVWYFKAESTRRAEDYLERKQRMVKAQSARAVVDEEVVRLDTDDDTSRSRSDDSLSRGRSVYEVKEREEDDKLGELNRTPSTRLSLAEQKLERRRSNLESIKKRSKRLSEEVDAGVGWI